MKKCLYIVMTLILCLSSLLTGCKKQEEAVISVEPEAVKEESKEPAEKIQNVSGGQELTIEAALSNGKEPGTFLQEERVTLYSEDGEIQKTFYRMQGSYGYSIAFDTEYLSFDLDESADRIYINGSATSESSEALILISENMEYALEELADEIVLNCSQECLVEEITIGEEEYPTTWITYTEETERGVRQIDYYLVGFENRVIEIQLICSEAALETHYENMQIILSTLRLDSIAEG